MAGAYCRRAAPLQPCVNEEVIVHGGEHTMVDVTLADGSQVTATDEHPFWNATDDEFAFAIELTEGDQVLKADGLLPARTSAASMSSNPASAIRSAP